MTAAAITGGVSLAIELSGESSQAQRPPEAGTPQSSSSGSIGSAGSSGSARRSGAGVTEYADWGGGVQVYADNRGTASDVDAIAFDQVIEVSCVAPNDSGIRSINAFYLIGSGQAGTSDRGVIACLAGAAVAVTHRQAGAALASDTATASTTLTADTSLTSANGDYRPLMTADGDLIEDSLYGISPTLIGVDDSGYLGGATVRPRTTRR